MLALISPTAQLYASWLESHREWGPGSHEDGFGLFPSDEVDSEAGFAAWLERLALDEAGSTSDEGTYRGLYRWIVEGDTVLGGIALRHGNHPFIDFAGHIGYGIRPSARGRGHATAALGQVLDLAAAIPLERVLLVCETANGASAATIERNGGVLERTDETDEGPVSRYWITLAGRAGASP